MTAPLSAPPYALAAIPFPFPGLAALAARAPVGGDRETVLACITLARLAAAAAQPVELAPELRRERAEAARSWLATLPIEQRLRTLLQRGISATGSATAAEIAAELDVVREALDQALDTPAANDLLRLAERLRG